MALYDFVRSITKSALMVHLKNIPKDVYKWRKDLLDAVVTKNELLDWMESGGTTHTHDTEYISIVTGADEDNIPIFDDAGELVDSGVGITAIGAGSDTDAIHDNVSGEIQAIAAKSPPIGADIVVIEDSEATWAKKQITLTDLVALGGGGVTDHGDLDGLSDDDHTQYLLADGTRGLSADWDAGSHEVKAETFESDVATGTAPLVVASDTEVTNLNSEFHHGLGVSGTPPNEIEQFLTYIEPVDRVCIIGSGYSPSDFIPTEFDSSAITMTVYNNTGSQIDALKACYISGDSAGTPLITLADADAESTASKMLVITNENIADDASGSATIYGWVTGLSSLTAGAVQYLSTTDGGITETPPSGAGDVVRTVGYAMSTTEMFFCPDAFPDGFAEAVHTHVEADITDLDHTDATAIHDNVAAEISAITRKAAPIGLDYLLIEDSEASNAKKYIKIEDLPFGTTTGGGGDLHFYFEDPPYVVGHDLDTDDDWTNIAFQGFEWTVSSQEPPGEAAQGCAIKLTPSTGGARARWDGGETWTSGVVDVYYRIQAGINQMGGVWIGDSTFAASGIYFGIVTVAGGDTVGYQYACYGTPETYHVHFGSPTNETSYWIRGYIDLDNGLGKMKGWSGAIEDEPAPWGVERTFTGAFPSPAYLCLHVGTTSNAASFIRIWELHVYNDYVISGSLGDLDHGSLEGLGDDDHTQYLKAAGTRALTADWDAGGYEIRSLKFYADQATGTAPYKCDSTTVNTNLNADLLDGNHSTAFVASTLDSGQIYMTVKNTTGVQIDALKVCYISGDSSGTPLITLADADAEASGSKMLVLASANIANNASGLAVIYGWLGGFSSLTAGAIQYLSTTDGGITETAPVGSGDVVRIVGYAMSSTEVFFNPSTNYTVLP